MVPKEHGGRKIITHNTCPPIPWREFDWCAYFDGDEELGNCGYGATEQEAVKDLISTYGDDNGDDAR